MNQKNVPRDKDIWKQIEQAQQNPEFIRAVYEFVRESTKVSV